MRAVALLCVAALLGAGCSATHYAPQVVARGELTLRYDGGFEMSAGGRRVSRGLLYKNLDNYVRCVPKARENAERAARHGSAAVALSILGGTFGGVALGGLYGVYDEPRLWYWVGGGLALATVGAVLAGVGRLMRNSANGHAVDAMNYYNDSVGSLGATCDDLRYPPPAGPAPEPAHPAEPEQLPPPPTVPSQSPAAPASSGP